MSSTALWVTLITPMEAELADLGLFSRSIQALGQRPRTVDQKKVKLDGRQRSMVLTPGQTHGLPMGHNGLEENRTLAKRRMVLSMTMEAYVPSPNKCFGQVPASAWSRTDGVGHISKLCTQETTYAQEKHKDTHVTCLNPKGVDGICANGSTGNRTLS
ncbi:hypothetical protein FB45DRAFT_871484 [Roridomyces roridus]|uniref:Uncharacterized protein n=1 Tax=Roridomyces roridus TaxID=1738132 RepID=A0AAD7BGV5_9AGAR|nr:hypothetical protein FB45DRAFT_871484 [Roridomyces roridus]